ncbi:hypothetical protein EZV73_18620 [Acidaminobacter sp. JC074]|uniref:hypothetical protein n=1 Tax=Acidaminobacter sp. JC074 TaxID=2530199 RepID=UPI001F101D2D|nr:hypothetical protein [Acidaminobacter sp. JC074]MCH4889603.1 hypothetical protein [Acidaminobacter sp. JC074]
MKDKKELIILLIATIPLLIFGLFVVERDTVSRDEIQEDSRRLHQINENYNEASHLSSHIGGLLYYDHSLRDHTFSVYLDEKHNQGFRSFHSGSSSFIDRGVQAFYYENFGTAFFQ